ncbi:tetratricopeptide repeat protein [Marinilabiliaceae bacterium JC017]|nr:tetratricopeptide repeat protein [Marinilabiliaceae bacterium JC017]
MKFTRLLIAGLILSIGSAFAQKGVEDGSKFGHGEDSVRCLKNLSLYNEYYKQGNIKDALPYWQIVFNECPLSTVSLYSDGAKMMVKLIKVEKDATKKKEYYETLMKIYDQRIKYFGDHRKYPESYVLGLKAIDMLKFNRHNVDVMKEAYGLLGKAIEGRGNKSQPAVTATYMTTTVGMYKLGEVDEEAVVNNYTTVTSILEKQVAASTGKKKEVLSNVKNNVEKLFAGSGAATCETIEKIFAPQLDENKENLDWLKRVNRLLAKGDCGDAELFYKSSEYLHVIEPSSSSAFGLAKMYLKLKDLDKAISYYKEAIELEEDPSLKGTFHYQMGLVYMAKKDFVTAKSNALKAAQLRPDWGTPYMLIGDLYAAGASNYGSNEFEHKTVYWAAVDKFIKAKRVDPSIAESANKKIGLYSQHFPNKEEIFFQKEIQEGSNYTIGGWINETTKVRSKK